MGRCFSVPTELFETAAPATNASIGGLLAEGQTPAALGETYVPSIPKKFRKRLGIE
jgi:hypothetical protein